MGAGQLEGCSFWFCDVSCMTETLIFLPVYFFLPKFPFLLVTLIFIYICLTSVCYVSVYSRHVSLFM